MKFSPARSASRLNADGRGRTTTSRMPPAQNSRSHAAPPAPTWSIRPIEAARPSCTQSIESIAIEAPARAEDVDTDPVNAGATVRVHVVLVDTPFRKA